MLRRSGALRSDDRAVRKINETTIRVTRGVAARTHVRAADHSGRVYHRPSMTIEPEILACWSCLGAAPRSLPTSSALVTRLEADAGTFFLKARPSVERAQREVRLLQDLARAGLPAPIPIPCVDGSPYARRASATYWLARALPGAHLELPEGTGGLRDAARMGQALAKLHRALGAASNVAAFPVFTDSVSGHLERLLAQNPPLDLDRLAVLTSRLAPIPELPTQLLHRDPHRLNLLFRDGEVTGYLDFDQALLGPRLLDLCYCATGILSERFRVAGYPTYWVEVVRELARAYAAVSPLSGQEIAAAWSMLATVQLIFVSYCLAGGQVEAARMNQDMLFWMEEHRDALEAAFR